MGAWDVSRRARAWTTKFSNALNFFDAETSQDAIEELDFRELLAEPTGFPNRTDSEISFVDGTLTFTIQPKSPATEFSYWCRGKKFTKTSSDSVVITDSEGPWFIYYVDATLTASQVPWTFGSGRAFVAYLYWNAADDQHEIFGEERHGFMPWATHKRLHEVDGTRFRAGDFGLYDFNIIGDGSLDSHAQVSLGEGTVFDEDIDVDVIDHDTSPDPFNQPLSIAQIPIAYRTGVGVSYIRHAAITTFPLISDSPNTCKYNKYDSGTSTWSLENVTEGYYFIVWVFASTNIANPISGLLDDEEYAGLSEARNKQLKDITGFEGINNAEIALVSKLIFQTSTSYTNTPKAALRSASELEIQNTDRYPVFANYNGNANVGRYLEIFPGIDSEEAPFPFDEPTYARSVTVTTSASNTGTIGFFEAGDLVNPVFSVSLTAESFKTVDVLHLFQADEQMAIRVTSGAFSKPRCVTRFQTV